MKCTQPGCSGTIVDGYCDVCGMAASSPSVGPLAHPRDVRRGGAAGPGDAPSAATAPHPSPRLATGPSIPEGGACLQPGCSGTIDAGYCNVCGTPADQQAPAALAGGGLGRPRRVRRGPGRRP